MLSSNVIAKFWSKVQVRGLDECWEWTGRVSNEGYGLFSGKAHGLPSKASRIAFLLTRGKLTSGLMVRHLCHNRPCCNPLHLAEGTCQDNMDDQLYAGRRVLGAKHHSWSLTDRQRRNIKSSDLSNRALAKEYGVSEQFISKIRTG